ncbi:hypothetical protein EYF80_032663 [Liparis tanakae]|uniref:Uncharacterized protein n=1 Tax=Liparis tanakae TaxID=230148 RepID=A0A4Z2GU03_9TELE|nr:hypothetical protein EYF80_032663 [Liparis tanakae]
MTAGSRVGEVALLFPYSRVRVHRPQFHFGNVFWHFDVLRVEKNLNSSSSEDLFVGLISEVHREHAIGPQREHVALTVHKVEIARRRGRHDVPKTQRLTIVGCDHSATNEHSGLQTLLTAALSHSPDREDVAPAVDVSTLHVFDPAAEPGFVSAAHIKVQGAGAFVVKAAAGVVVHGVSPGLNAVHRQSDEVHLGGGVVLPGLLRLQAPQDQVFFVLVQLPVQKSPIVHSPADLRTALNHDDPVPLLTAETVSGANFSFLMAIEVELKEQIPVILN